MDQDITQLLDAWHEGDREGLDAAMALMNQALRSEARKQMGRDAAIHTIQPTALVNEVYLRLADNQQLKFNNRRSFFFFAGRIMRQILVEYARGKKAIKRGAGQPEVRLDDPGQLEDFRGMDADSLLHLDQALSELEQKDPRQVKIVELRFFAGLSLEETAEFLETSVTTVKREWTFAKRWLARELRGDLKDS